MTARTALEERTSSVFSQTWTSPAGESARRAGSSQRRSASECRGEPGRGQAGLRPQGDHDMDERHEFRDAVPEVDARECVHADDQHDRLRAALGAQLLERQDRVGRAGTPKLAVVHHEVRIVADGGPDHFEPGRRVGKRRRAVRRFAGRHECDGFEAEQFVELVRRAQVPVVDRVEHPAEHAERPHQPRSIAGGRRAPEIDATRPVSEVQGSPFDSDWPLT